MLLNETAMQTEHYVVENPPSPVRALPLSPASKAISSHRLRRLFLHEPLLTATIFGVVMGILLGSTVRLATPSSKAIDLVGTAWTTGPAKLLRTVLNEPDQA